MNKIKNALSIAFWVPTFVLRAFLIAIGFVVVPLIDTEKNKIWGNFEHPVAPDGYRPGWRDKTGAVVGSFLLWALLFGWWLSMIPAYIVAVAVVIQVIRPDSANYLWLAYRNPANSVRFWKTLLAREERDWMTYGVMEPELSVRAGSIKTASRFSRNGLFSEYWRVWKSGDEIAEFRIGWKRSPVPGFGPTLQLRRGE